MLTSRPLLGVRFTLKYILTFFVLSFSANTAELDSFSIEHLFKGIHYESIGQSRYSLGKKGSSGKVEYPKCRKVFNIIYREYKGPHIVQKYYEGSRQYLHFRKKRMDLEQALEKLEEQKEAFLQKKTVLETQLTELNAAPS